MNDFQMFLQSKLLSKCFSTFAALELLLWLPLSFLVNDDFVHFELSFCFKIVVTNITIESHLFVVVDLLVNRGDFRSWKRSLANLALKIVQLFLVNFSEMNAPVE